MISPRLMLCSLAGVAVLLLALFIQNIRIDAAKAEAKAERAGRETAEREKSVAFQVAQQLRQAEAEKENQRISLANQLQELEQERAKRLKLIRSLQNEVEELRKWSGNPLPDIIVSMRERPAITGADHYREHLRNAGALPPFPGSTSEQRRSESTD